MQKKLTSIIIVGNQNKNTHSLFNFRKKLSEKVWYKKLDIERTFFQESEKNAQVENFELHLVNTLCCVEDLVAVGL